MRSTRRRPTAPALTAALAMAALISGACSGGGGSSGPGTTITPALRQQAAVAAARACRMWAEVISQAVTGTALNQTTAAPFDAKSAAIAPVANAASGVDPAWNALATDIAGATDFASAALPDINNRITADCKQVPADAIKTAAGEPDPFSTTTTP